MDRMIFFTCKNMDMHLIPDSGSRFITALGWTLLDSLWQALIILVCQQLLLVMTRQASSRVRYRISAAALISLFSWFGMTYLRQLASLPAAQAGTVRILPVAGIDPLTLSSIPHPGILPVSPDLLHRLQASFPLLSLLYFAGIAVFSLRMVASYLHIQFIRASGSELPDPGWKNHLDRLKRSLSVSRPVRVLVSARVHVPVMAGWIRPVIFLPIAAMNNLSTDQVEAILLHELAHIRREDYLVNLLQSIIDTLLFFNPFAWMISRSIRKERESCCDDLVIASVNPIQYARALVALEENRIELSSRMVMSAVTTKQQLFYRIKRMMEMKKSNLNYGQRLLALLVVGAVLASIAWLSPARDIPGRSSRITGQPHPGYGIAVIGDTSIKNPKPRAASPVPSATPGGKPGSPVLPPPSPPPQSLSAAQQKKISDEMKGLNARMVKIGIRLAKLSDSLARIDSRKMQLDFDSGNMDRVMHKWDSGHGKAYWSGMQEKLSRQMKGMADVYRKMDWSKLNRQLKFNMDSVFRNMNWKKWQMKFDTLGKSTWIKADSLRMKEWPRFQYQYSTALDSLKMIHWSADMQRSMSLAMRNLKLHLNNLNMMQFPASRINMTGFADELKLDHLIPNPDKYSIELNSSGMFIDGRKQPRSVYDRYRDMVGRNGSLRMSYDHGHEKESFDSGTNNSIKK